MVQVVWILAFIGAITGTASTFLKYPHHLNRLFDVNNEPITEQSKEKRLLCDSKQCQELAKILMEGMNESVDPCENFYEYACGNWKIHNPLPENEKIWNLMKKTQSIVDKRLLDIIEQDPSPDDFLGLRLSKRAYKACMDADELDKNGLREIVSTLSRAGGWPLIMEEDEWDEQIYKWQQVDDYYARLIGLNSLHDLSVDLLDWENMKDIYLRVNNPHYPMRAYKLVGYDEDDMDDSDENNESGEGSQERGSEEEPNSEEIEVEDEDDKYQKQLQRRANKRISVHRDKTKARKSTVRRTAHSVRQSKAKSRERSPKRMQRSLVVDKSLRKSIVRSKRRHEVANDDMYFSDVEYNASNDDDEENEEDNEGDEENGSSSGGYNDDDEENEENGSGSGGYNDDDEEDEENGSGSGDYYDDDEEDEENGSGSGDYYDDEYFEREKKEKQEREQLKKEYAEYILNVSLALTEATGVSIPKEKLEEDIDDLIKFQINLIKLIFKDDQGNNSTLRSLQKLYDDLKPTTSNGKINWIKKVQDLFAAGGMEIDDNVKILIPSNGYIKGFRKLLDRTPSRTIVNYIHWNFLSRVIQVTTKEMKDLYNNWSQKKEDPNTRSTECIEEIDAKYYLGYEYIKRHFPDEIKKTALDMIDDIEKEIEYQIEDATWMNDEARHFVLDKLMFMKKMIGYPKEYRNNTIMETYFRGLSITPSRFENFLSVKRYTKQQNLKRYYTMEEFTLSEFSLLDPLVVNAFFVPFINSIEITAADLQSPLFEFHHPWYSNFGFIGYVMAHEVNHGFDSGGIMFDREGNYIRLPASMQEEYKKRAKCFEAQFTKYSMEENRTANIPLETYGERTQEENIADSMGLQAAFKAYQRRQRKCANPDPMLPGLQNFTNEQVFFLSFANIWCEDIDLEKAKKQLMTDSHSLGPLRVIGSVSNSEDFAKAYNCPKGSPMNPIKKCNIWKYHGFSQSSMDIKLSTIVFYIHSARRQTGCRLDSPAQSSSSLVLIAVSLGAIINASLFDIPRDLENLFGSRRVVTAKTGKKERSVCESEECKIIANVIKDGMDESVDPCDDFYEYACGKWSNNNPIPENEISWSLWNMVEKKVEKQVQEIIQTEPKPNDLFAVKLAKKWYKSCIDEEAEERRGLEPILSTLWRYGGWPLIMEEGEWDGRIYNWQTVDDHFARLLGANSLHDLSYRQYTYDSNTSIIVREPHLPPSIYRILSPDETPDTDSSDENNESGEGSQERGSEEKEDDTNVDDDEEDSDNVEDEENSEDNEVDTNEERLRKKKLARRKAHERLGNGRRKSNRNKSTTKHIGKGQTRKRTKRDIMKAIVFNDMRKYRKHAKHSVHHSPRRTKGTSSKRGHLSVSRHDKSSTKQNSLKHTENKKSTNDNVHSRRNSKRNKAVGNHVHEKKTKNKSKSTSMKTSVHSNKQHTRRKIDSNHRVHRVGQKTRVSKHVDNRVSPKRNNVENESNNENDDDNESNNEESDNNSNDNEVNKENNDDSVNVSNDDDEDTEDNSADEDDDEDNDEEDDSNDEDNEEDDNDKEDEDEDEDVDEEEERRLEIEKYKDYIFNVSLLLSKARGIEVPEEKLKKDIASLVEFAIKLGDLTLLDDGPYETTMDSFQEMYDSMNSTTSNSKVNWKKKVQKVFAEAGVEIEGNPDIVISRKYFKKLPALLDETPSETIVNYIHWLFISKIAEIFTKDLKKLAENWSGSLYFATREEQCVQQVEMSSIIGYEYVRKHFPEQIADTARDMIDDIQKEVEYQIKEATWLDEETEHFILDKLVNMKNLVGHPDWYRNTTLVKQYFHGLTIGTSYYENVLNYMRYIKWKRLRQIIDNEDNMEEMVDPLMLNAFFVPTENFIAITAVDFQSPFFALNRPWNVNYGIIGVIMAHEVNHGFDDSGRLYDRKGSPMEWLSAMAAAYDQRALCFVDQFNKYSLVKGKNATVEGYGNQTIGENIADTMGLQAVYRAYQRRERKCVQPDPALPGLEKFSNDQTFFLSFANLWCESEDPEWVLRRAKYDVHSTGRLRVIGSVSNSEDFAKAFNCPVGSPMNPENKCNIWILSLGAVINSALIPSYIDFSHGLERLFDTKRLATVKKEKNEREICESEECKLIAKIIKESMDESVDPCDDFYQYACGNWSNINPIPENRTSWSVWDMVEKKLEKQIQKIIETKPKSDDVLAVKFTKMWYQSCMDEEAEKKRGVEPIISTLWRHGGWPLIMGEGEWDSRIYSWQIVDDQFARLFGLNTLHDIRYTELYYGGNRTLVLETPHLPVGVYSFLSFDGSYSSSDSSDENNESGEGSQERGSKEKRKNDNEDDNDVDDDEEDSDNVEDEENSEDNEVDTNEERLRKKKLAGRKAHERLGNGRRKNNRNKSTTKHIGKGQTRKRTKRDIMKAIVFNDMRKYRKHAKHSVHHSPRRTKGTSSKRGHLSVSRHDKSSTKQNSLKHTENKKSTNDNVHSRRNSKRNKAVGNHVHEKKTKNKSKSTSMKTSVHSNKQHTRRKIDSNHRVHRVGQKTRVSKHVDNRVSPKRNNVENESNNENDDDNESNNEESDNNSNDNEVNKENNDDSVNVSNDDDEDTEDNSADEDDDKDNDEKDDSNDKDDEGEDNDKEDEDEDEDVDEEEERRLEIEKYKDYIFNVSLVLSKARAIEVPEEKMRKDIANMVEFIIKLGELSRLVISDDTDDSEEVSTTLDSFQELYDSFKPTTANSKVNWKRKVQKLFDEAGIDINGDVDIVINTPKYFEKLRSLLDETPNETIVNYVHWNFVEKILFIIDDLRKLAENWMGMTTFESRKELCVAMLEMNSVVGYEYVRLHLSEEREKMARDMVDDIQKEVEYQIKEATWLDEETEHFILDKLVNMKNLIGYPEWYLNSTLVKQRLRGLTVGPSFYENVLNYVRYLKWDNLREIEEQVDDEDVMNPLELNAFFMPTENSISITAVDLQSPLFALNRPWSVNYGIIGVVMGHEVNHGFDDSGRVYDRKGSPMEWLAAMAAAYDQRALCFVDQFNKYSLVKGENTTVEGYGNQTIGENIADTMGLLAVYRAYQRRERKCVQPDPALPGLENFSNDQIFFLSFANTWCEAEDPEATLRSAKYDVHSTGRLRVIGSVSNSEDFSKAFSCPVGSPMNPENKCNIWV
ncbi:uncharacterized protein LOC143343172 [Colletes latitarsis]|uniref:uncharacterized protein LOC143343172 n=1 Tax=Colletes latitarsis TaxID=2605962 RepID=UPI0040375439